MKTEHNISLLPYNTFGIDVKAKTFISYDSEQEIQEIVPQLSGNILHIGGGSNLLFLKDFDGTILYSKIRGMEIVQEGENEMIVRAGAGLVMDDFIAECIKNGWYGLENLSLIPGQVGASAVQNIGAYGAEAGDRIVCVNTVSLEDGTKRVFDHDECMYSYRYSIFKSEEIRGKYAVTSVEYRLSKQFEPLLDYGGVRKALESKGINVDTLTAKQLRDVIIDIRREKLPDPAVTGNAGSFFMNPIIPRTQFEDLLEKYPSAPHYDVDNDRVKVPAGWMIDQRGWKGKRMNSAGVHDKQALVLINCGGATGQDIVELCETIRRDVSDTFGIDIKPEVNFI